MGITVEGFTLEKYDAFEAQRFRAFHIEKAEEALRSAVGRGFDAEPVLITDGQPRKDYRQVKLFGVIEFAARPVMKDAVLWALNELRKRSPVLTGRYATSHVVLLNGAEIAGDPAEALAAVKPTDRVQIVNPQPYAKKIEGRASSKKRGIGGVRGLSSQAPGGVYRVVQRLLLQRYGRVMFFDFKYQKLNTGLKVKGYAGGGSSRRRILRDHVYPIIQFYIKPTGQAAN